ncbi:MAG: hypothetical protein ACYDBQ_02600 [Thermoplasmatota archaeon]
MALPTRVTGALMGLALMAGAGCQAPPTLFSVTGPTWLAGSWWAYETRTWVNATGAAGTLVAPQTNQTELGRLVVVTLTDSPSGPVAVLLRAGEPHDGYPAHSELVAQRPGDLAVLPATWWAASSCAGADLCRAPLAGRSTGTPLYSLHFPLVPQARWSELGATAYVAGEEPSGSTSTTVHVIFSWPDDVIPGAAGARVTVTHQVDGWYAAALGTWARLRDASTTTVALGGRIQEAVATVRDTRVTASGPGPALSLAGLASALHLAATPAPPTAPAGFSILPHPLLFSVGDSWIFFAGGTVPGRLRWSLVRTEPEAVEATAEGPTLAWTFPEPGAFEVRLTDVDTNRTVSDGGFTVDLHATKDEACAAGTTPSLPGHAGGRGLCGGFPFRLPPGTFVARVQVDYPQGQATLPCAELQLAQDGVARYNASAWPERPATLAAALLLAAPSDFEALWLPSASAGGSVTYHVDVTALAGGNTELPSPVGC